MKDDEGKATGKGYNYWRLGWFEPRPDCKVEQCHASEANMLWDIGESYCSKIIEGNSGVYCIPDDPHYPYYIVKWVGEPWQSKKDGAVAIDAENFVVHKGDWLCKGI